MKQDITVNYLYLFKVMPVYMNGRSERVKKLDGSLICDRNREDITVYNFVIAPSLRMSWKALRKFGSKYAFMWPSQHNVWYPSSFMTTSYLLDAVSHVFLHRIPGAVLDRLAVLKGERPRYLPFFLTFPIHSSTFRSIVIASSPTDAVLMHRIARAVLRQVANLLLDNVFSG